jgi:hypothetical protein
MDVMNTRMVSTNHVGEFGINPYHKVSLAITCVTLRLGTVGRGSEIRRDGSVELVTVPHLVGVRVTEVVVLNPGVGVHEVTLEHILSVVTVGFEVGLLELFFPHSPRLSGSPMTF